MEDPQEDPYFCVCNSGALLGDLLGVNKSVKRDFLSVLSIYPRIFLRMLLESYLIREILLCLSILIICSHVCQLFWFSCQYLDQVIG